MRLWHKDLIPYLPRNHLLGLWRECCRIAKEIDEYGEPLGKQAKPLMNYPLSHFRAYAVLVEMACGKRGIRIHPECFWRYFPTMNPVVMVLPSHPERIFPDWMNETYRRKCLVEFEQKYLDGKIDYHDFFNVNWRSEHGENYARGVLSGTERYSRGEVQQGAFG